MMPRDNGIATRESWEMPPYALPARAFSNQLPLNPVLQQGFEKESPWIYRPG
jgi:hypothetical protein